MPLELVPIVMGVIVALIGAALILDASLAERLHFHPERRRRERAKHDRLGEGLIGGGMLSVAAALIGRDVWRFGTVAILLGTVLLAAGAWLNRDFLKELLLFRGAARRTDPSIAPPVRQPTGPAPSAAKAGDAASPRRNSSSGTATDRETPIPVVAHTDERRSASADPRGGNDEPQRRHRIR
jgi:hypothetical protein